MGQSQSKLPSVPYEKTDYIGLNPMWYETCYDSTFKNDRMDGYNHFRRGTALPLLHGNNVYTVLNINHTSGPYYGSYLQCREIETGKLIWQYLVGVRENGHYEVIRLMYIDGDNKLNVISQISKESFESNIGASFLEDMIIRKMIFDPYIGIKIYDYHRDFDDDSAFDTQISGFKTAKYSYIFREDTLLRYIEPIKINDTFHLRSVLVDDTGKKVGNESLLRFKYITQYFNLIQIAPDTFIHVEINYADSTLLFRYLSPDLKEYDSYATPKTRSTPELLEFVKLSTDKKKILFEYIDKTDPFFNYVELLVYDTKANLIKRAALDNYNNNYFEVLKWEDEEGFIVLKQNIVEDENNNRRSVMNVSHYDDENGEYIINTFTSTDSSRYAVPIFTFSLSDEIYYTQFAEFRSASAFSRDIGAYAISQMLLDGKILFLPSSIDDVATESSTIALYPNPTRDDFTLTFDTEYTGTIQVYSMSGELQLQKSVSHSVTDQVDISTLDAGMYIVQCISSDHKRSPVSLKLVKM